MVGHAWLEHSHPPNFFTETMPAQGRRLKIGVPAGDVTVTRTLVDCLAEPLFVLYVLHTARGEGEIGRYQSPKLSHHATMEFLDRYAAYFTGDGRHDLWIHSPSSNATLVWDRHNHLFAYGSLECFESKLRALGFEERPLDPLGDHMHHYRAEFDADAFDVLAAFDWKWTELRPEDVQR
jgi:hypothetical protein